MAGVRIAFPWRETWKSRWHGRQDGRRGIPPVDQDDSSAYEKRLAHLGSEILHAIAQEWERLDMRMKAEYCTAYFHWKTAEAARKDHESDADNHHSALREAQQLHTELFKREHLSPGVYVALLVLIGVCEFPINKVVFELFGQPESMTYLMTGMLAFAIPIVAHFVGIWLKEEVWRQRPLPSSALLLIASLLFPLLTLWGFGYVRERYLEQLSKGILDQPMDPRIVFIAFVFLGYTIWAIGMSASYVHHDPELKRARHNLKLARSRHSDAEAERAELEALERTTQETYQDAAARRANEFERQVQRAREWEQAIYAMVQTYRIYNQRARQDATRPKSFEQLPPITFPEGLKALETRCRDLAGKAHDTTESLLETARSGAEL
jgi:hypothetical protein